MHPDHESSGLTSRFRNLDRDASVAVSTRGIQGGVMALGAAAVIWRMTPVDQGFSFAFISFGIMLRLCDFGPSHATLRSARPLMVTGRASEIASLGATALRINVVGTLVPWAVAEFSTGVVENGYEQKFFLYRCSALNHG